MIRANAATRGRCSDSRRPPPDPARQPSDVLSDFQRQPRSSRSLFAFRSFASDADRLVSAEQKHERMSPCRLIRASCRIMQRRGRCRRISIRTGLDANEHRQPFEEALVGGGVCRGLVDHRHGDNEGVAQHDPDHLRRNRTSSRLLPLIVAPPSHRGSSPSLRLLPLLEAPPPPLGSSPSSLMMTVWLTA